MEFAVNPPKVVDPCHVIPSRLYSKVAPNGEVTTIVPVFVIQVGWVMVARGTVGTPGTALIIKFEEAIQVRSPAVFRTLIV